jgi:mannosyl-oligosaccharide alpha-1,2-mannosidase
MFLFLKFSRTKIWSAALCIFLLIYFISHFFPRQGVASFRTRHSKLCLLYTPDRLYIPPKEHLGWRNVPVRYPAPEQANEHLFKAPQLLPRVQYAFSAAHSNTKSQRLRREAVAATFNRCWNSYKANAWMKDELSPMSGGSSNRWGGWGATLVDTLDTLWIMGLHTEFKEAVNAAVTINFSDPSLLVGDELPNKDRISVFETTIRFVGGFLAAYEIDGCHDKRLLDQAMEIADMLYVAFDTPSRMPVDRWNPQVGLSGAEQVADADDNILANMGSLSMEFTRLSQLTGDMRYFDAIQQITNLLDKQQSKTKMPGMWPQRYDVSGNDFTQGNSFPLGAEADSAYEYLLKMYMLLGATEPAKQYERMYKYAMDTAVQHNLFRPMTPDNSDVLLSGKVIVQDTEVFLLTQSEHLACFLGGMFALGSRIFGNQTHLDVAERLTAGCIWGYKASPSGILPENVQTVKCPSMSSCEWNETLWLQEGGSIWPKGFTSSIDARYHLRPEALESIFIMYRITGNTAYQDIAWEIFQSIEIQTSTELGNAALTNAFTSPPPKDDFMESFWLAETLKYLYLIFSDTDLISLDDFVLTTEAHPFRIRA